MYSWGRTLCSCLFSRRCRLSWEVALLWGAELASLWFTHSGFKHFVQEVVLTSGLKESLQPGSNGGTKKQLPWVVQRL